MDKQLLVVMDKAKAEKVIIPNPGAMSDNFRCEAGPHYDYYRLTDLKDHKIDLGGALWSNKKIQCLYRLYVS